MNQFSKETFVSVVIPTFNQGSFIKDCLESILRQTHTNIEIIIQDSLSNDDTEKICKEYAIRDRRIEYHREKDTGQSNAINRGLKKSNGILWTWLCSDDRYNHRESIEKLVEAYLLIADNDKSYVGVYGDSYLIDDKGNYLEEEYFSLKKDLIDLDFKHIWPLSQPSSLLLRSSVLAVGGVREDLYLGMDLDLFLKLLKGNKKFLYVPFPVADNRLQANAKTVRLKALTAWNCLELIKEHLDTIGRIPDSTYQVELGNYTSETFFQKKDIKYFEEAFSRLYHYEKISGRGFSELTALSEVDAYDSLKKSNLKLEKNQSLDIESKTEAMVNYILLRELILTSLSQERKIQKLKDDFDYVNDIMKLNKVVSYLIINYTSGEPEYIIHSVNITSEDFTINFKLTKAQSERIIQSIHWIPMQNVYGQIYITSLSITLSNQDLIKIPINEIAHNGSQSQNGRIEFLRFPGVLEIPVQNNFASMQAVGKWKKYEYQELGDIIFKNSQKEKEVIQNSYSFKLGYLIFHPHVLFTKIFKYFFRHKK